jgi:uncharacterized membrane protein
VRADTVIATAELASTDVDGWVLDLTRAGAVGAGLMAGLFFAFSTSVMPALRKLPAPDGAAAMQQINREIQNPLFLLVFMGSTLIAAAIAVSTAWTWDQPWAGLRLAGGSTFVAGNFLTTMAYNVPRNDQLDRSAAFWPTYLDEWVPANHLRALLTAASCVLLVLAART